MKLYEVLELSFRVWKHTENPVLLIFDDGEHLNERCEKQKKKQSKVDSGFPRVHCLINTEEVRQTTTLAPRHRGGHPTLQNQNRIQTHGAEAGPVEALPPSDRAPAVRGSAGEGGALVQHSTFWSAPY